MKSITTLLFLLAVNALVIAQTNSYPFRKLSVEPAIGMRLSAAFGLVDIQLSGLVQYNLNKHISLASHTAFSFDLNTFNAFKNIDQKYSVTTFQKFGIGATAYTKKTAHTVFLMGGAKYFAYSGSVDNPNIQDNGQTKFTTFAFDKGLMYNLKIGRGKRYFSGRVYAPVFDGKWIAIENTAIEVGLGFLLK